MTELDSNQHWNNQKTRVLFFRSLELAAGYAACGTRDAQSVEKRFYEKLRELFDTTTDRSRHLAFAAAAQARLTTLLDELGLGRA